MSLGEATQGGVDHPWAPFRSRREPLPEREAVRLSAGLEEGDLERPFADRVVLAAELVETAVAQEAIAVGVDVHAVRRARRLAVEEQRGR